MDKIDFKSELERIPLDKLVKGTLYEIRVKDSRTFVSFWLPYQGTSPNGRLMFADGPNGVFVEPDEDLIKVYYDHLPF